MAENKINIGLALKAELETSQEDLAQLRNEPGLKSKKAQRNLNEVEGLLNSLSATDFTKLKGADLTRVLNQFAKIRDLLDSASRSLTNFSNEYLEVAKKVEDAREIQLKATDNYADALSRKKSALADVKINDGGTYFQNKGGRRISNLKTIVKNYRAGTLRVFNQEGTELQVAATGIPAYSEADSNAARFKAALDDATKSFKELETQLGQINPGHELHPTTKTITEHSVGTHNIITGIKQQSTEETQKSIDNTEKQLEGLSDTVTKQDTVWSKAFKRISLYAIAWKGVNTALRETTRTIKEVDKALTEQAMVTGLTRQQAYGLLSTYQDMASSLGATVKEVSSAMTEFLRQGRSIEESKQLTQAAVAAAKVASISVGDSINYLTTAVNGFQLSADQAMKVSDKFAAVAAASATDYEELAVALSKVAAQANLAGMSIDYTTALLATGIEATREAPETIGTALKTVIARMREITDYGATLDGDTDLNNVESQLAYIGIQLTDNNGELRSTEDVLDELGRKWNTLNSNQQAAIAKALAGTRQQSRLISMMNNYERVLELNAISQRSAGATMAQMESYLTGMDAALNNVTVAWEKIVSTISNSDIIINIINSFSNLLGFINSILSNTWGMVAALTAISLVGINILNNKIVESTLAEQRYKYELESQKLQIQQQIQNEKIIQQELKRKKENQQNLIIDQQRLKTTLEQIRAEKKAQGLSTFEEDMLIAASDREIQSLQNIDKTIEASKLNETSLNAQLDLLNAQTSTTGVLSTNFTAIGVLAGKFVSILGVAGGVLKTILTLTKAVGTQEARNNLTKKAGIVWDKIQAGYAMATSASAIPYVGWGIALAILAALGIGLAVAYNKQASYAENTAKNINTLSSDIFNLNKKSTALQDTIDKFEDLDNKVIKTKEDLKELNSLLESAGDSLSDDEKDVYNSLQTNQAKKEYLQSLIGTTETELQNKRQEQVKSLITLYRHPDFFGIKSWEGFLTSDNSDIVQARDSMYALNSAVLQHSIDDLKETYLDFTDEAASATETLIQSVLDNIQPGKAFELLLNPDKITQLANTLRNVTGTYTDSAGKTITASVGEILDSDDRSIRERIAAFESAKAAVESLGDIDLTNAFSDAYIQWESLIENFNQVSLKWIDENGITASAINDFAEDIRDLGYTAKDASEKMSNFFELLENGEDISSAVSKVFDVEFGSDKYNQILNDIESSFGTTLLDLGQKVDKFTNTIDSFYEKASTWSSMSETERDEFISENQELFEGENGAELLDAFKSNNNERIAIALSTNKTLIKQREQLLDEIDRQIAIEEAKSEDQQNKALLARYKAYRKELENEETVYLASLETRYKQQQEQLSAYKEYLQEQTDALTDSLDKRKEAYQKYFDDINEAAEDEDYEDQAAQLIANISKLSSSTNADAMAKTADLTKQLEELEADRIKELRERAQDAILENMEDEISVISENLEKLLANEQALLNAMTQDISKPYDFVSSMLSNEIANGNTTTLGLQTWLDTFKGTFASLIPEINWDNVDISRDQNNNVILNIAGKEIVLSDTEQSSVYDAVMKALRQVGKA